MARGKLEAYITHFLLLLFIQITGNRYMQATCNYFMLLRNLYVLQIWFVPVIFVQQGARLL
jgi:hypothetical protein